MPVQLSWILAGPTTTTTKSNSGGSSFLLFVLVGVVLLFLFTRSQKRNRRRMAATQSAISVGQRVITSSGIHATVVATDDTTFDLEIAEGVVVTFAKAAVTRLAPVVEAADEHHDHDSDEHDPDDHDHADHHHHDGQLRDDAPVGVTLDKALDPVRSSSES